MKKNTRKTMTVDGIEWVWKRDQWVASQSLLDEHGRVTGVTLRKRAADHPSMQAATEPLVHQTMLQTP